MIRSSLRNWYCFISYISVFLIVRGKHCCVSHWQKKLYYTWSLFNRSFKDFYYLQRINNKMDLPSENRMREDLVEYREAPYLLLVCRCVCACRQHLCLSVECLRPLVGPIHLQAYLKPIVQLEPTAKVLEKWAISCWQNLKCTNRQVHGHKMCTNRDT